MKIRRVTTEPGVLEANTIYLVQDGANDLQVVVVGTVNTDVRRTLTTSAINTLITNAISGLDGMTVSEIVADIAARDALTLTENVFVLVQDASADATVDAGSALYLYNSVGDTFVKVAEYESMDITIPNQGILEDLSDVGGVLHYQGEPVGTVTAGTNEW